LELCFADTSLAIAVPRVSSPKVVTRFRRDDYEMTELFARSGGLGVGSAS
jgi:hypothetical protein